MTENLETPKVLKAQDMLLQWCANKKNGTILAHDTACLVRRMMLW